MTRAKTKSAGTVPRRPGRSTLWIIVLLLAGSGLLRLASGTGRVVAEEVAELTKGPEISDAVDPATCAPPPELEAVLDALKSREQRLKEREDALADRAAAIKLAEEEIGNNLAALRQAEEDLAAMIALSEDASEDDLARLTSVYESMKPKEAAALFETMSPDFAAGFLGRMRPDAAAAILAGLPPDTAYAISVVLAGRNANAPSE